MRSATALAILALLCSLVHLHAEPADAPQARVPGGSGGNGGDGDDDGQGPVAGNFDVIVVGAGTAGCIYARRLSDEGHSVAVIDLGARIPDSDPYAQLLGTAPFNWVPPFVADNVLMPATFGDFSTPRKDVLVSASEGGGDMVNSGIAHVGPRGWYDSFNSSWWSFSAVSAAAARVRARIPLMPPAVVPQSALKWLASAGTAFPINPDLNDPSGSPTEGFGNISVSTRLVGGVPVRDSTLFAYLDGSSASVLLRSHATRIRFSGSPGDHLAPKATWVDFVQAGKCRTVRAKKGVVLAAGAFGTAKLLLDSGVGPAAQLAPLGIPVVSDLPVGEGLQDHHTVSFVYANNCPMSAAELQAFPFTPGTQVAGFIRSNASAHPWPDIQYTFVPLGATPDQFTLVVFLVDPEGRGSVSLAGADPLRPSLKRYDYGGTPRDLDAIADALDQAERFMSAPGSPFAACVGARLVPPPGADIRQYAAATAVPGYHVAGTCALGKVVRDSDLSVMGTRGLYVGDGSIWPSVAPCNTAHPTRITAERGSDLILAAVA